jgi:AhpC/TSA family
MIALAAFLFSGLRSTHAPAPGDSFAPFVVQTRSGAPFGWHPGRITVICFCAMWCDTWKEQLPRLSKSELELKGLPVDYLAISVDGRWMERTRGSKTANLLSDPGGAWTASIGIDRVPYTLVLDASGIVRSSTHGILRSDDIVRQVRSALTPSSSGPIYLTFDGISDEVLDVLRAESVTATFFCDPALSSPAVARARREGHSVQALSVSRINSSTIKIRTVSGQVLELFVDDPYDYTRPGEKELVRRILNNARPRAVIYLHAGVSETIAALPGVIDNLRSRGYKFEQLSGSPLVLGSVPKMRGGLRGGSD